jgi:hypothetical protein
MKIEDWRARLPCINRLPVRSKAPLYITVHFNGPAISQRQDWEKHLRFISEFHAGPYLKADGIQYHVAILPDGTIVQTRDEDRQLWHCGNITGNNWSLAAHFPLGGTQTPTDAAWQAFCAWADDRINHYGMGGRNIVYGHRQWPDGTAERPMPHVPWQRGQGPCPGEQITALLQRWKAETQKFIFRIRDDIDFAAIRQGPATWFPIAWDGAAKAWPGQELECDEVVTGESIGGNSLWAHWPGAGFISMTLKA